MATKKRKVGYAAYRTSPLKKITDKARKIRKPGETWLSAVKRASKAGKISGVKRTAPKKSAKKVAAKRAAKVRVSRPKAAAAPKTILMCNTKEQLGKLFVQREMATTKRDKKAIGKKISEKKAKLKLIAKL